MIPQSDIYYFLIDLNSNQCLRTRVLFNLSQVPDFTSPSYFMDFVSISASYLSAVFNVYKIIKAWNPLVSKSTASTSNQAPVLAFQSRIFIASLPQIALCLGWFSFFIKLMSKLFHHQLVSIVLFFVDSSYITMAVYIN